MSVLLFLCSVVQNLLYGRNPSEVLSFFLFQSAEAKSVRQNSRKFLPVIVHNLCFVTFSDISRVENSASLPEATLTRVCF